MICVYFFTFRAHAPRSLSALNLPWLSTQFVGDPAFAFSQADVPRKISARDFKRPQPERCVDISPCCTRTFALRTERERDDYKLRTRHGFPCGFPGEGSTDGNHHTSVDASSTGLIVPLRSEPTHAHRGTSDARLTQNSVRFAGWDGMNIGACRRGFTGLSFPFASCAGLNCVDKGVRALNPLLPTPVIVAVSPLPERRWLPQHPHRIHMLGQCRPIALHRTDGTISECARASGGVASASPARV